MMYAMNIWSCLWASIGILISGEVYGLYNFLRAYPSVTGNILLLGLTGAIGQVRIEVMKFRWKLFFSVEFYLSDDRMVRPIDLFNFYHDSKVLYHPLFDSDLWQSNHSAANVWNSSSLSRIVSRTILWQRYT